MNRKHSGNAKTIKELYTSSTFFLFPPIFVKCYYNCDGTLQEQVRQFIRDQILTQERLKKLTENYVDSYIHQPSHITPT